MSAAREFLHQLLAARLPPEGLAWLERTADEVHDLRDPASDEFPTRISLCSRHVPRTALAPGHTTLAPDDEIRARAERILPGWNPERWNLLDAARAFLVLSRSDLEADGCVRAIEECFRYADVGELIALYRSLALVPQCERFAWRAGEGCRSSMGSVFEAAACDTPLPVKVFDDLAWRQLVIKALFVEAPLWRVWGLDSRLDAELARMALDLADERRSAGRVVRYELWLCLGAHGGARGLAALEHETKQASPLARRAAALALSRAGAGARLNMLFADERDETVRATVEEARAGRSDAAAFRKLDPNYSE